MLQDSEMLAEKQRLTERFSGADENQLQVMDALIEQAALETVLLRRLNQTALETGLVRINQKNPMQQTSLPVSKAIATHSAALTNILDKLCRRLCVEQEDEDEGLGEYE